MKNIVLIIAIAFSLQSFGQKYVVTPNGLRDKSDTTKTYLVLEANGLTAEQLFDNAIKYINENYKNPEEVVKAKTNGEYLRFNTHVPDFLFYNNSGTNIPIQATYTTELRFKDGKVKYEIISLDMVGKKGGFHLLFSGGLMSGYIIYKKNGSLFKEETKTDIENYFSLQVVDLLKFLKEENKSNDW
ncbi:MAG: DUF4468 domain-containing protein [Brumimicrobium sp.]|nr:DUF4468 domain-containing protein [Brumimicrobium sp.]